MPAQPSNFDRNRNTVVNFDCHEANALPAVVISSNPISSTVQSLRPWMPREAQQSSHRNAGEGQKRVLSAKAAQLLSRMFPAVVCTLSEGRSRFMTEGMPPCPTKNCLTPHLVQRTTSKLGGLCVSGQGTVAAAQDVSHVPKVLTACPCSCFRRRVFADGRGRVALRHLLAATAPGAHEARPDGPGGVGSVSEGGGGGGRGGGGRRLLRRLQGATQARRPQDLHVLGLARHHGRTLVPGQSEGTGTAYEMRCPRTRAKMSASPAHFCLSSLGVSTC